MKHHKILFFVLLILILSIFFVTPAFAGGEAGSLTLHYVLNGYTFQLYHVATFTSDGAFQLNTGYDKLPVDWSDMEDEDWYELANNLDTMVVAEKITADSTATTDTDGTVTVKELPYGLWLIAGGTRTRGRTVYTTQPLLVTIPGTTDDGTVDSSRELTISKYSKDTMPDPVPDLIQVSVVKVWEDNRDPDRPKSIQVTLWRDETQYDIVTLSADNNWRYVWKDLKKGYTWRISENSVPDGYTVSYTHEGYAFYITNTKQTPPPDPPTPPPDPPTPPPDPPTPPPDPPAPPPDPPTPPPDPPTPPPDIPQTGVNWTRVAILFSLSLVCLIVGVWRRKQSEE